MTATFTFDRTVSENLLDLLTKTPVRGLVKRVKDQPSGTPLYDLQLRRDQRATTPRSWATLYYGLTKLIDVEERGGRFRLHADKYYKAHAAWDEAWTGWRDRETLVAEWAKVAHYLDEVVDTVDPRYLGSEGPVHAALSSGTSDAYRVINREATPSFLDSPTKKALLAKWVQPFNEALDAAGSNEGWWPKNVKVGASLDHLAVDIGGRLMAVEAKYSSASARELSKVTVQASVYATMFAELFATDPDAVPAMRRMLAQRTQLRLTRPGMLHLRDEGRVVPIVAIGPGRPSTEVHRRLWEVARVVMPRLGDRVDPVEVWYLDGSGRITEVERLQDADRAISGTT